MASPSKHLILDSCTKTIFSLNGKLYKQIDGVSMGSPLGPTLANIIMTEFEDIIIKPLINSRIGSIPAGGPIVDDEFHSTIPGLNFDMCMISTRIKAYFPLGEFVRANRQKIRNASYLFAANFFASQF